MLAIAQVQKKKNLTYQARLTYEVRVLLLAIFLMRDLYFEGLCFFVSISLSLDIFSFFNLSLFFCFFRGTWVSLFS